MNSAARMNSGIASSSWLPIIPFSNCSAAVPMSRPGQKQVQDRAADHRVGDGQPDEAQGDDGDERQREGTGEVHSPEVVLVMSISSGASPRSIDQIVPGITNDDRGREDEVHRVEKVETDLEVGRALDLHERHVLPVTPETTSPNRTTPDDGDEDTDHTAAPGPQLAGDEIEADLLVLPAARTPSRAAPCTAR